MTALLTAGFADTYRNIGAVLRLFWPVAATYLIMILWGGVLGFFAAVESDAALLVFVLVAFAAPSMPSLRFVRALSAGIDVSC